MREIISGMKKVVLNFANGAMLAMEMVRGVQTGAKGCSLEGMPSETQIVAACAKYNALVYTMNAGLDKSSTEQKVSYS
jgi:hypothetical protein